MSFVSDTLLSGGARLHVARGGGQQQQGKHVGPGKRLSQTQAGRLDPLIRLLKDPFGVFDRGTDADADTDTDADADADEDEDARAQKVEQDEHRKQLLYLRLRYAECYDDWKAAAAELDTLEGNDAWKLEDESSEYDAELIKLRLEELDEARLNCDVKRMLYLVRTTLTRGLGGMGDLRLYKHSHVGTKKLIERYIDSAVQTLAAIPEVAAKQGGTCPIKPHRVTEELLRTRQSFGRTALLMSGGGTFGMNHIGVVKCLWELRLLPRIISGASAGSIVCAVLCSKNDDEIPGVLSEFCHGDLDVFEKAGEEEGVIQKVTRFLKYGSLFDISHLQRVMRQMLGDITFQESYNRTRRILNITVSSASVYELPRLLNYVTAPDVMIWSAVCASCSVPLVFSAASLMAKDQKTGKEVPWNPSPSEGWIDGSVDNDLPMTRLAEMFNVNHFIVSQVNPHVVPFLAKEEHEIGVEVQQQKSAFSAGPGWMHNMASFAKGEALHRLEVLAEMGVFPNTMTKVRSILSQRYSGDITIFPAISYANFPKILSNPTTDYMLRCLLAGEQATWLKVSRIQNHVAVELALDEAVNQILPCVHFSKSQANLRLLDSTRPASQGADLPPTHPLRSHKRDSRSEGQCLPLAPFTPFTEMPSPDFYRRPGSRGKGLTPTASRPYLPSRPSMRNAKSPDFNRVAFSTVEAVSSTDADDSPTDADVSDNIESDTTENLSSPSLTHSPPPTIAELRPLTSPCYLSFPPVSKPPTLAAPAELFNSRNSPRDLAPAAPSTPELRYKRLFHPPEQTRTLELAYKQEIKRMLQPLSSIPVLKHSGNDPEHQRAPDTTLTKAPSLDDRRIEAMDAPVFGPLDSSSSAAASPLSTRDGAQGIEESYFERKMRDLHRGNGTPRWGSPTRGTVLRGKRSSGGSMSGERPA